MTNAQRLQVRLSEIRQRLNELSALDDLTDEQRAESDRLTTEYATKETQHRAAVVGESVEAETRAAEFDETGDGDDRERRELRGRCRLGRYMAAALDGLPVQGAEAELSAAAGVPGAVPLELFEVRQRRPVGTEDRAITPAPATTDESLAPIVPAIFDRSAAAWLGIEMPTVGTGDAGYPVLSTSLTGGPWRKARRRQRRRARSR